MDLLLPCITAGLGILGGWASYTDIRHGIIPNAMIVIGLVIFGLAHFLWGFGVLALIGSAVGLGIGLLFYILTHGIGLGDVKYFAVLGMALGPIGLFYALFLATLGGGLWGTGRILFFHHTHTQSIRLGPWLAAASMAICGYAIGHPAVLFF